jgi:hypothetical protein
MLPVEAAYERYRAGDISYEDYRRDYADPAYEYLKSRRRRADWPTKPIGSELWRMVGQAAPRGPLKLVQTSRRD